MEYSNNIMVMLNAYEKGYSVDKNGDVFFNGRKRSLTEDRYGYLNFTVSYNSGEGKRVLRRVWVHKLQAYQKFGKEYLEDGVQSRHLDGNNKNNTKENISIGTPSENQMDRKKEERVKHAILASSKLRRFTDDEVAQIVKEKKGGASYRVLAEKYKTSKGTIYYLINNASYNRE